MKILLIFTLSLLFLICSTLTGYSQGGLKNLQELTSESPIIITGQVLESKAAYGKYLGREDFIFTYVTIAVQRVIKGLKSDEKLTIKVHGGRIGDRVIGGERSFQFLENEEVLLFLSPIDENYHEIYSVSGMFTFITKDEGLYFDTTMLREDAVSNYGYRSAIKTEHLLGRINDLLKNNGD